MSIARRAVALFFVLFTLVAAAAAAADCILPEITTGVRPGPADRPTEVAIAFRVLDFMGVDDVNQQISVDVRATITWSDPRLAGHEGCRYALDEVWFPPLIIVNSTNLREGQKLARNQVTVGSGGRVTYVQRYTGEISSYHALQRFPFDRHRFQINITSPDLGADALRIVPLPEETTISTRLNIEGWDILGVSVSEEALDLPLVDRVVSVATLAIEAHRQPTYYVFRVILPLLFVVATSWAIFWVPPEKYEFQIGLGATAMLTAIAFSLSIAGQLPDLGYLTVFDKMLIWAMGLVFLSIIEALACGILVHDDRVLAAKRLDRISRAVFPALLIGGWLLMAV